MSSNLKHLAWDMGAIDAAITEAFGASPSAQKTTKTRCGKRVAMSQIDNENPTCLDCLEVKRLEQAEAEEIKAALGSGFDCPACAVECVGDKQMQIVGCPTCMNLWCRICRKIVYQVNGVTICNCPVIKQSSCPAVVYDNSLIVKLSNGTTSSITLPPVEDYERGHVVQIPVLDGGLPAEYLFVMAQDSGWELYTPPQGG